jgi:hypothetical protein
MAEFAEPVGQVRHPVHQIALLIGSEIAMMLAHETPPVRVPHHPVGDAGHRPVDRDLSRVFRIASQAAPAKLNHGTGRGCTGQVHKAVDAGGVPSLPQQSSGTDQ